MWVELEGGNSRSLYCINASRRDRDTSGELVVVQSTKYWYKPINCSQAVRPTSFVAKSIFWVKNKKKLASSVDHLPLAGGAFFIEMIRVATAFRTNDISDSRYLEKFKVVRLLIRLLNGAKKSYLGNGHFPLWRSSSLNFFSTSWKRCSNAVTANRPATPPSVVFVLLLLLLLSSSNENCNSVSKHVFANSSRNLRSASQPIFDVVAEWIEPLFKITTTFKMNWCGISCECGRT